MSAHEVIGRLPDRPADVLNLLAGQLYFGRKVQEVRTLLGSCVGLTFWHPGRRLGGMCHFLLPSRRRLAGQALDARFGEEAFRMLVAEVERAGLHPAEFEVQLYGGADTQPNRGSDLFNIGQRNIELGCTELDRHGFQLMAADVGDHVPRTLALSMANGEVRVRRGRIHEQPVAA